MHEPVFEEIENNTHYKYWNCPIRFIPDNVLQFMEIYNYYKTFPGARMPDYKNVSKRFLLAIQYIEMKKNENLEIDERY